jgi:very-short-patch-repair endonuclease
LWSALREAFPGRRLRRQHPVGRFVVDFACPAYKLALEIDGGQHETNEPTDLARTAEIARRGYRVLRFWNNEVLHNLPGVLQRIQQALESLSPPFREEREGPAQREGEVGASADGDPHLTPTLSAPEGGEGASNKLPQALVA